MIKQLPAHDRAKCKFCSGTSLVRPCFEERSLARSSPALQFHLASRYGALLSPRFAACELEVITDDGSNADRGGPATVKMLEKWGARIGGDAYGEGGFEINMSPAQGTKFEQEAEDFEFALLEDEAYVNECCGGHIHTDARGFCLVDLRKLIFFYYLIEPAIFKAVPSYRSDDCECCESLDSKLEDEGSFLLELEETMGKIQKLKDFFQHSYKFNHYDALNVGSMFAHKTVEWRHPPGLVLARDMKGYASIFTNVMDYVQKTSTKTIYTLYQQFKSKQPTEETSTRILLSALSSPFAKKFLHHKQLHAEEEWRKYSNKRLSEFLPKRQMQKLKQAYLKGQKELLSAHFASI